MLKVASFDISDAKGMNDLLSTAKLASGMHILVSEGKVCIPYEDGTPASKEVIICELGEDINKLTKEIAIIEHSQLVLTRLQADAKDRRDAAYAKHKAALSDKKLEAKYKEAEQAYDQTSNQILMNQAEMARLQLNVEFYEAKIKQLQA